ncbi:MAG: FAD-linked oxidase C-terminal domain-containing protein [Pseudomonadota bacterium]
MSSLNIRKPSEKVLWNKVKLQLELKKHIGSDHVIIDTEGCNIYSRDAYTSYRQTPLAVVLPENDPQVIDTLQFCRTYEIPIIPRGAGTSLSGCASAYEDAVVLCLSRMNKIVEIDYENRTVTAQTGITNFAISETIAEQGFFYAPNPASQMSCTLGGNIGTNAGGINALKYGTTSAHILGMKFITIEGDVIQLGGNFGDSIGYDLGAFLIGSEGQLGIVTEATVRIIPKAENARPMLIGFETEKDASKCIAAIMRSRITPSAMEFMDKTAIQISRPTVDYGPSDKEQLKNTDALLLVEVEGSETEITAQLNVLEGIAFEHFHTFTKISNTDEDAKDLWQIRRNLYPALCKQAQTYIIDGTIPANTLPDVLPKVRHICANYNLQVIHIFHAGDGTLKPIILYNSHDAEDSANVTKAVSEILRLCLRVGGYLSGEHGIGLEKRDLMQDQFGPHEIGQQTRIKHAFDSRELLNPGKVFPVNMV